jgi:phage-related protein
MRVKPIIWIGSSKRDLLDLPEIVKDEIGFALYEAQKGGKSIKAKPFKGFGNASVLEVVESNYGETYRAVYTVRFEKVIAVLHVFHKKSKKGIATPKQELDLIQSRYKRAEEEYKLWLRTAGEKI